MGVLWLPFHVIMAIVCLDLTNKAVQEMDYGMVVGKEIVIVCYILHQFAILQTIN